MSCVREAEVEPRGNAYPLDICAMFGLSKEGAQGLWTVVLLIYCFFASTMPVWLLLQPRDYLNSYLLYAMLAIGLTAVFVVCPSINIDAFSSFAVSVEASASSGRSALIA